MAKSKIKKEKVDNVGIHSFSKKADIFFSSIVGLVALSCILPFIFVVMISLSPLHYLVCNDCRDSM